MQMSNKPARNDPCPCGSGRKFKKCHGSIATLETPKILNSPRIRDELQTMIARREAQEFQRREQQGLGRPIISAAFQDHRVVAVGQTMHFSKKWKTFHDFLKDYPRIVLGTAWWMSEVAKPQGERHRILTWATRIYEQHKAYVEQEGLGVAQPATGAISAYMRFAYDLYGLKHAIDVQELLIERIKSPANFPGALYEVRVAAALLRAGFDLQFEDETDRRSTHVEFIATHMASGTTYAVEAKRREGVRMKINKQMYRALSKQSDYPRIVFIDTNDGRLDAARDSCNPISLVETEKLLKLYERDPVGQTLPQAYVIATYNPEEHYLDTVDLPSGILLWGFRQDDLKPGLRTVLQQIQTRRRHVPIFALLESMQKHRHIPSTFDGEADAFLRGSSVARLQIGQRMLDPKSDGTQVEVTLESGVVMPERKAASCVVRTDAQEQFIVQISLSDEELQAHAQHPTTFFGMIDRNAGRSRCETDLDWFDFFWETYAGTHKEKLVELMKRAPDIERLKTLTQDELAAEYCARMANSMMRHGTERRS
jgi:hypothetical protein